MKKKGFKASCAAHERMRTSRLQGRAPRHCERDNQTFKIMEATELLGQRGVQASSQIDFLSQLIDRLTYT
jgi:hypothetical protein